MLIISVALRKKHGLSQEQFAEKIGVTRQAVSNWECRIATPDVETLVPDSEAV
ncbi:MAG: helix-turn-helix transcriptional regulator [Coprococcus eutactus]